jgi:histone H1/5
MSDEAVVVPAPVAEAKPAKKAKAAKTPKKAAAGPKTPKKPRAKSTSDHPKVSVMVNGAIKGLGERGGSSLKAIKKYIGDSYKVDAEKLGPFIKR